MSSNPVRDLPMSSGAPAPSAGPTEQSAESNPIRDAIAEAIAEHKVILFMKGTPEAPACGFSARTVAALQALDTPFAAVDILPDPRIRQAHRDPQQQAQYGARGKTFDHTQKADAGIPSEVAAGGQIG